MQIHSCGYTCVGLEAIPDPKGCGEGLRRAMRGEPERSENEPARLVRVLIADPDRFLGADYRDYLVGQGFDVATAADGLECIKLLREFRPDVLVLEPALPWGGGDGVVAVIHEDSSIARIPVILATFGCDRGVLYNLAPFPMDDYQQKPLSPSRLADRIRRVVAKSYIPVCSRGETKTES